MTYMMSIKSVPNRRVVEARNSAWQWRVLTFCGLWLILPLYGQTESQYPRMPWGGYPYPPSYDAEIAAPDVHRVLFEDANVMFLEVSNPPELDVKMHGHPYPSVFARDTGGSQTTSGVVLDDTHMDPDSTFAGKGWGQGPPPAGLAFPRCTSAPPEGPHRPLNHGKTPVHFYRIEFRRLDGDALRSHWREWYPWMLSTPKPVPRAPAKSSTQDSTQQWPYSNLYDSILAAPNNYRLLYEDSHVRLLEVGVRPGEATPMHGHPYASVLAFNTPPIDPRQVSDVKLDPGSQLNGQGAGHAAAPGVFDMTAPTCTNIGPQAPHAIKNMSDTPLHYYRIEFKRVDGDAFQSRWQEWYPWMKYMKNMR
jgi:hypothetical protein